MSEPIPREAEGGIGSRAGLKGIRAAMYGEMAAAASRKRPGLERDREWDAALEGAIRFLEASGLDERTRRRLLEEAAAIRKAGALYEWETPAGVLCDRLAYEFRTRIDGQ